MKKKVLSVLFSCILIFSAVSVVVYAEETEKVVLDNSVFYIDIPENYMYYTENSHNFCIMDSDFGGQEMEFFVEGNLMFPEGIAKAGDEEIVTKVRRIVQWGTETSVNEVKREVVNGQKAAIIVCTEDFLGEYESEYYVFTTKEAVCVISISYNDNEEKQEIEGILETFTMNGTYFEGDKPVNTHDFTNSPDYYTAVEQYAEEYYDYSEDFDDGMWGVVAFVGLGFLFIPGMIIALILLIFGWRKNKKLVKEYESYFGPIYAVRNVARAQQTQYNGYNVYNPQQANPYIATYAQPQPTYQPANPQPVYQPVPQPVPQPANAEGEVKTVLNGEVQDNIQQ